MPVEIELRNLMDQSAIPGGLGALGRLLALAMASRKPKGFSLLWEIPLAMAMGLIGKGLADWLGVTHTISYALIIGVSYIGPRFIDIALETYEKKLKSSKTP